jgi:xylulokinase
MMPGAPLFVAIDVGTTGARAMAVDLDGGVRGEARSAYATATPRPGWAEQDPRDWREAALDALTMLTALPELDAAAIAAIGLTGQCPTIAPFDRAREPVGPGLLYRDNRATVEAEEMRARLGDEALHARTGHIPSAFHVGPKVLWLREHDARTFAAADCFMQPRDVVLHALTGFTATDETHANSTLFFDLRARSWAEDLLDTYSLSAGLFPAVAAAWSPGGEVLAGVAQRTGVPPGCPVVLGAADSQCAAYGSGVLAPGPISEMSGASSCLNSVLHEPSDDLRITHYSYLLPDAYCTELGVNVSGAALQWALSQFGLASFAELESRAMGTRRALDAERTEDPRTVAPLFLPYLGDGERDDPTLRAAFIGLSDRHGRDELAYAALEGVAFAVAETVSILHASSPLHELRVGGGGARVPLLGQIKADALEVVVKHLKHDSAPVGAAMLAARQTGFADEARAALQANLEQAERFEPDPGAAAAVRERYSWFLEVRASQAVRLQP